MESIIIGCVETEAAQRKPREGLPEEMIELVFAG